MTIALDDLDRMPARGRVGLLERAKVESPESALALASVAAETARQQGGRLVWAGHVDQVFIGDAQDAPDELLVSEFPSARQAKAALATRREFGIDPLVRHDRLSVFVPASIGARIATDAFFAMQRLLRRKTPTADLSDPAVLDAAGMGEGPPEHRPSPDALRRYVTCGIEGKVVMVNLLAFERDASGDAAHGRAAYGRYGRRAARLIARLGGRLRAQGTRVVDLGEPEPTRWDALALVEYPSRADFIGMVSSPEYTPGHADRDAGLERTELLVCTSHATFF